ncbi:MAG: SurA N-terminal domain-containing protein [Candidatus Azosocius agrarius]|nr:MAG: SurA N-terminal domain-containing protein [Gammaproteobacteria bacterium]
MIKYFIIILFSVYITAHANYPTTNILTIINNEPITTWDIKQFCLIQLFNKNKSFNHLMNNTNVIENILNKKILEKIKIQYAKKINIKIKKELIKNTILLISKKNNLSLTDFINILKKHNINYHKYYNFIKNQLIIKNLENKEILNHIKINSNNFNYNNINIYNYNKKFHYLQITIKKNNNYIFIQKSYKKVLTIYKQKIYKILTSKIKLTNTIKTLSIKNIFINQIYIKNINKLLTKFIYLNLYNKKYIPIRNKNNMYIYDSIINYKKIINNFYIKLKYLSTSNNILNKNLHTKIQFIKYNIKNKKIFSKQNLLFSTNKKTYNNGGNITWINNILNISKNIKYIKKNKILSFQKNLKEHCITIIIDKKINYNQFIIDKMKKFIILKKNKNILKILLYKLKQKSIIEYV